MDPTLTRRQVHAGLIGTAVAGLSGSAAAAPVLGGLMDLVDRALQPGRLTRIVCAPGQGAPRLALFVATVVASRGRPVLYWAQEAFPDRLTFRQLALWTHRDVGLSQHRWLATEPLPQDLDKDARKEALRVRHEAEQRGHDAVAALPITWVSHLDPLQALLGQIQPEHLVVVDNLAATGDGAAVETALRSHLASRGGTGITAWPQLEGRSVASGPVDAVWELEVPRIAALHRGQASDAPENGELAVLTEIVGGERSARIELRYHPRQYRFA